VLAWAKLVLQLTVQDRDEENKGGHWLPWRCSTPHEVPCTLGACLRMTQPHYITPSPFFAAPSAESALRAQEEADQALAYALQAQLVSLCVCAPRLCPAAPALGVSRRVEHGLEAHGRHSCMLKVSLTVHKHKM